MITIIGTSSAGLFLAHLLAKAGFKVTVFEEKEKIGPSPRTLIVTKKLLTTLGFEPSEAIVNKIKKVTLFSKEQKASLELGEPDLIIEREKLLKILERKALEAGAKILLNHQFLDFTKEDDTLILKIKNLKNSQIEEFKTKILVGADGTYSTVAKMAGFKAPKTVFLLQAKVKMPPSFKEDTSYIWFDKGKENFFFWLIPKSKEGAAVGLISKDEKKAEENLKGFLKRENLATLSFQKGVAPLYRPFLKVLRDNIFLLGDAAAQVKNTTVGGTVSGLEGAKALAKSITENSSYEKNLKKLKRELKIHWGIRLLLNNFEDSDYDSLLKLLNPKVKEVLKSHTRDEAFITSLKLLFYQPRFLKFFKKIF